MSAGGSFQQAWLAETVRLREAHHGPLQDSAEVRRARAEDGSFSQRILRRAVFLGRREKLDTTLQHWAQIARWSLVTMLALAFLTGAGTALGALGDGTRPVNLLLALAAMLGLPTLTFILWLAGLGLKSDNQGAWLGQLWLSATRKLARGPDAALAPRALAGLLGRNSALRWTLSAISHLLWLTALVSLLATLLAMLSARRYSFNWETTLLSPDAFVTLTQAIGWLPTRIGFDMPAAATIRISDGMTLLPEGSHALWSSWLIGCVVVYGVFPRMAAFVASAFLARRSIKELNALDTSLPGYASLRPRLMPPSESIAPDAPAGRDTPAQVRPLAMNTVVAGEPLVVGLELPPDTAWPPAGLPTGAQNAGVVDNRGQRHAVLDHLHAHPVPRLLVIVDSYQTPDRGALAYIAELAAYAEETRVAFTAAAKPSSPAPDESRLNAWREQLQAAGIPANRIHATPVAAFAWLEGAP